MTKATTNQSDAAKLGLNKTLDPVEKFILEGLQRRIYETFGLRSGWLTSNDRMQVLQTMFGNLAAGTNETKIQYPYCLLKLTAMNESLDRGNSLASSLRGITAIVNDDWKRGYNVKFIPVDFNFTFEYVTNSHKDLLLFASQWLMAKRRGWLKFNVAYGRVNFSVGMLLEGTVNVPDREDDSAEGKVYNLQLTLTVQGFTSQATLIEQQLVTELDVTGYVSNDGTTGVNANSTSFWSFSTPADNTLADASNQRTLSR